MQSALVLLVLSVHQDGGPGGRGGHPLLLLRAPLPGENERALRLTLPALLAGENESALCLLLPAAPLAGEGEGESPLWPWLLLPAASLTAEMPL